MSSVGQRIPRDRGSTSSGNAQMLRVRGRKERLYVNPPKSGTSKQRVKTRNQELSMYSSNIYEVIKGDVHQNLLLWS